MEPSEEPQDVGPRPQDVQPRLQVQRDQDQESRASSYRPTLHTEWWQYSAGVAACLSLIASGAWFCWPAPLLPRLLAENSPVPMTPMEASWMVSSVEIGNLFSPFPASFFSDRFGRKPCMLLCAPLFLMAVILNIYIKTWFSLCAARFIVGFSIGIPYTIVALYLGEIASPDVRGAVTSLFHIAWSLGCLFPYCVGPFLSFDMYTYVTFVLTIIFVLFFVWQPESPYYYAMKEDAEGTLRMLRRLRISPTEESLQQELEDILLEVKKGSEDKASWKDAFASRADRKALLLIFIVGVVSYLSGHNAILTYTTDTFSKFPNSFIPADYVTILIGLICVVGSIFAILFSDTMGRRFLLLVSSIGCMFSLLVASVCFYFEGNTDVDMSNLTWLAPLAVLAFNFFVTAGMHPVCVTYTSELFPTRTRGLASGFSSVNLTLCSFVVLIFYEPISSSMGIYFIYLCYAMTCFVGTFLFYFMMPETKEKTFLEIREGLAK